MWRFLQLGLIALAVMLLTDVSQAQQSTMLTATKDTSIWSGDNGTDTDPELSNGGGQNMIVGINGQNGGNKLMRSLVAFDVGSIPANATITSATLQLELRVSLFNDGGGAVELPTPLAVNLHKLTSDWGEGTSDLTEGPLGGGAAGDNAETSDATWTFNFYNTSSWTNPGGDYVAQASATTNVQTEMTYTWTSAQLAADVQSWVDGTAQNYGWMLISDETYANCCFLAQFATKDATEEMVRPKLIVEYEVDAPPQIVDSTPDQNQPDVDPATNLSITLSESARVQRKGVSFVCSPGGGRPGAVSRSGNTYTLDPRNDLPAGAACALTIPVENVTDSGGNNLLDDDNNPGDDVYTLTFFVDAPPQITNTVPVNGAGNVAIDSNISLTFSESIDVRVRGVRFFCNPGGGVRGSLSVSGNTYTLNPRNDLPAEATCILSIPAENITDDTGNTLVDNDPVPTDETYTLSFSTESFTASGVEGAAMEEPEVIEMPEIELGTLESN